MQSHARAPRVARSLSAARHVVRGRCGCGRGAAIGLLSAELAQASSDGPDWVNRAVHRASNGHMCSVCQAPTPGTRTRAPLARSIHPCSRAVCRSNELVRANDLVEATGFALMATGALIDCGTALPARKA